MLLGCANGAGSTGALPQLHQFLQVQPASSSYFSQAGKQAEA